MPSVHKDAGEIQHIRIVQITALPPGWWLDEWNRTPAIALVEFVDNNGETWQDVLPLTGDLQVVYPGEPDWAYTTALFGDNKDFIHFREPEYEAPE